MTVILICPARHSNRERSDTSINSPSSTKFTLVFRKAQYFISSCRISQSYFQSLTCHHGVAVRQLVVIMTIYSPGSEGAALPSAPPNQSRARWPYSFIASSHIFLHCSVSSLLHHLSVIFCGTCCRSVHLAICASTRLFIPTLWFPFKKHNSATFFFFPGHFFVPQTVICPPLCLAPSLVTGVTSVKLSQPSCRMWSFQTISVSSILKEVVA